MGIFDRLRGKEKGGKDARTALSEPIGTEQIQTARQTMMRYKQGKAHLEKRIIDAEQWYKLRHWECLRQSTEEEIQPVSAWLFNCIANKHADAMDAFPSPNILPREEGDKPEAEKLSSIVPVVLEQCEFEQVYSDVWDYKLKAGTGIYGVFWDKSKHGGMGDINIRKVDALNLFWESGINDIQKSPHVFHVELADNDSLQEVYPELRGKLGGTQAEVAKYVYDDSVDTSTKSAVVDWYYKRQMQNGKSVLHYCKFVNDVVLFSTENTPEFAERGWYDHGMYPFVFDPLFNLEGSPCGFGYIDIGKSAQEYIDRGNQAILQNMIAGARPRFFAREDAAVNIDEFMDMTKDIVHVAGNFSTESIIPIKSAQLNSGYINVINSKIEELKETTGTRDVSTGGTSSGVTAASAIAALQEASGKLSRDASKAAYRAYRKIIYMVIELIRQFYDVPRQFRILGESGEHEFVQYSNAGIRPQSQGGVELGIDMGFRLPQFDIEVSAQKQNPYTKMSQNELALQFYNAGFFNPEMADQALMCLDIMDFERKSFVIQKISQQQTLMQQLQAMQQQMMMLAQMVDQSRGTNIAAELAAQMGMMQPQAQQGGTMQPVDLSGGEATVTRNARERSAETTVPR